LTFPTLGTDFLKIGSTIFCPEYSLWQNTKLRLKSQPQSWMGFSDFYYSFVRQNVHGYLSKKSFLVKIP